MGFIDIVELSMGVAAILASAYIIVNKDTVTGIFFLIIVFVIIALLKWMDWEYRLAMRKTPKW